jgi:hypothetical protein
MSSISGTRQAVSSDQLFLFSSVPLFVLTTTITTTNHIPCHNGAATAQTALVSQTRIALIVMMAI